MRTRRFKHLVSLCLLAALGGCSGGSSDPLADVAGAPPPEPSIPFDSGRVPVPPSAAGGLDGAVTLKRGCGWILAFDPAIPSLGNTAFPDNGARYWVAYVAPDQPAGTTLKIEGRYANTRYAALHVHDGNLLVLDAQAEYQLAPDAGAVTPWLDITTRQANAPLGGRYTARLRFGETAPASREANVLYRPAPLPNDGIAKRTTALVYRTYLPVGENTGGVGLPRITLQTPTGPLPLDNAEDRAGCAEIGSRFYLDGAAIPGITNALDPAPPLPKPVFKKFESLLLVLAGSGVGLNNHNAFAYIKTERNYGDVLLVRGLPPSHTGDAAAGNPPQVRYWSLCHYGFNTQKVYGCVSDQDAALDAEGRYTVLVSRDAAPPLATRALGFNTLPFGPERIGTLTMRELLAHPTFAEAIVRTSFGEAGSASRGVHQPKATYCSRAVFDAVAPQGAAAAFAACLESRRVLPPAP
ncbi:MAG: hypothetical protein V4709_02185 [Pseudomonadota bacterium]